MGSDWAKNCTVAAIRNSDSSRILSLAILLIFIVPIVYASEEHPPAMLEQWHARAKLPG
jgi:hypothetical protein